MKPSRRKRPKPPSISLEQLAHAVCEALPGAKLERARDVFQLTTADVVAVVTAEALELRLPTVEWHGPHDSIESSRFWKRVRWSAVRDGQIANLIETARKARLREFRPCKFCRKKFPPELRHGNVCHGCAEKHQGIVH